MRVSSPPSLPPLLVPEVKKSKKWFLKIISRAFFAKLV